jgi:hypothetical protein
VLEQTPAIAQLGDAERSALRAELAVAAKNGSVRSMRDAQRFAVRQFVSRVLKKDSLAQNISG